jgi:hypothetical protein
MLPSVMGSPASDRGRVIMPGEDIRASSATASSGRCVLLRDTVPDQGEADRRLAAAGAARDRLRACASCGSCRRGPTTSRAASAAASGFAGGDDRWRHGRRSRRAMRGDLRVVSPLF